MKNIVLVLIAAAVLFSAGNLQAAKKAGEVIDDSIFHDLKYGYSLTMAPGWKAAKIEKDKKELRVIIAKKSPVVPPQFIYDQSYFTEPKLTILADSCDLTADSILTLIKAQKREGDLIKAALKNFALVTYSEFTPEYGPARKFSVGGYKGLFVNLRKECHYNISVQGQAKPRFVQDFLRGRIYILKDGLTTLLIQQIAEKERYGFNEREFEAMIKSLGSGKSKNKDKQTTGEKAEDTRNEKKE